MMSVSDFVVAPPDPVGVTTATPSGLDARRHGRLARLSSISPTALGYLIGPVAFVVVLLLMRFDLVVRRPTWQWVAVFAVIPLTSLLVDSLYRRRPSDRYMQLRVAQNAAAVTAVIYLSGWGPVLVLAFAFVALENMSRDGSRVWRVALLWSLLGIASGQIAISQGWAPSVLSSNKANISALMGAFALFFVIRMAAAVMEQKEVAESSVSESEDRFRSLIQNSSDVTLVVDSGGVCTYVSPSVRLLLGFDPHEVVGRPAADFVPAGDKELVSNRLRSAPANISNSISVQFRMNTRDGGFRLVEAVVADQRKRPSVGGYVASIRDITERTKAAQDLQRSKESFQVLFEQHPHPMWVFDMETLRFLEVNQCATEKYGYTRDEFLSMRITDIRPDDAARRLVNYLRVERPRLDYSGVWRHRIKSGEIIEVEVTTHALDFRGRRGELVMAQDVTERVQLEQQLRENALHDPLTGLPNRALLLDRLNRLNAQAKASDSVATVVCLDLDNFKLINEAYGHDVGDGLIRAVGERLEGSVREVDTVGRIAADEFVILVTCPGERATEPQDLGQEIHDLISSEPFYVGGNQLNVTTSVGIISAIGDDAEELMQNAAIALGLAKAEGGNRSIVFVQDMQTAVDERIKLTMDLREAVSNGQFQNFYQPVVKLKDQGISGVEALIRWCHPSIGLIPPERFISLAEETGLIREIGKMVLRQACEDARLWQRDHKKLTVAVNVSVFQLRSDEFVSDVRDAVESSGLNPTSLVLEVTESILINNPETALKRLGALKELGVRLAIDDFGTGYSSLSYLRQFPFDIMKIDQSFVAAMAGSPEAVVMVRTMIQLGRQLKLEVVAEGVEDGHQLDILRRLHCQQAQGHLWSPAVNARALGSLLTEWVVDSALKPQDASAATLCGVQGVSPIAAPPCARKLPRPA